MDLNRYISDHFGAGARKPSRMGPRPPESDFQIIFELSLENFDHGGNDAELERLLEHDININRLQSENEYSAKGSK